MSMFMNLARKPRFITPTITCRTGLVIVVRSRVLYFTGRAPFSDNSGQINRKNLFDGCRKISSCSVSFMYS